MTSAAEKLAARVREALASHDDVTEKKMFGGVAFFLDGKMLCGTAKGDLMLRVGPERHEEVLAKKHVRPMDFTGRPMKGYVFVEPAGYRTAKSLRAWLALATSFTATVPARGAADSKFEPVIAAFAKDRRVTSGKMMASVGLKVNGKIFAMLVGGKLVAKLPKARVDELVEGKLGDYFNPRRDGRLMKEWVVLRGAKPSWLAIAKEALQFVGR